MKTACRGLAFTGLVFYALAALPRPAYAHESRPGYLELREVSAGHYEVLWKQPAVGELVLRLNPIFPDSCTVSGADRQLIPGAMATRPAHRGRS